MPSPRVLTFVTNLRDALPRLASIEAAAQEIRNNLSPLIGGWPADVEADLVEAAAIVSRDFEFVLLRRSSIKTPRPEWYRGPQPGDVHWPALEGYLANAKKWDRDTTIASINDSSNEVVSLLDNPSLDRFLCRGLVVGYVQSGKTANMTATIAKAVDRGYNFVVVLAGVTDKLRQQTQRRLEKDLVERQPNRWTKLTTANLDGDFKAPAQGHLVAGSRAQIAVMKKNGAPLRRLLSCIERTPAAEMGKIKILLVDDECDQAGVNGAKDDASIPTINGLIRGILKKAPAISYVGYTATPFANILINPYAEQTQELDDLYPKDFITALPLPAGYFGTRSLFGLPPRNPADPKPDEEGLDVIRSIPNTDAALLQPRRRVDVAGFQPAMADSLRRAILYFLCTCGARRARGQGGEHMTMLIHTSSYVDMHEKIAGLVTGWLDERRSELSSPQGALRREMEAIWLDESGRLPGEVTTAPMISFDQLAPYLPEVMAALSEPIENGSSDDRIDYEGGGARTYIVVGGSILARGLTLDGLVVSYFMRSSGQYDTLLQMGRWFGYRPGYEDLPRVWMPRDLQLRFRALAAIEEEIREEISVYSRAPSITPTDVAVRIRSIPGMSIVSRNRMRHAQRCSIGFAGRHVQTIRFQRRDAGVLGANWRAGSQLIAAAATQGKTIEGGQVLYTDAPKSAALAFFRNYVIDGSHQDLSTAHLLAYLDQDLAELRLWNIGVIQAAEGRPSATELGPLGHVKTVKRSALTTSTDEIADIKALMSKSDITVDCPAADTSLNWEELKAARRGLAGDRPLLLLYPIDRTSPPQTKTLLREPLDAAADVLAFGLVLPGSRELSGNYVSVQIEALSPEELEEQDQEEAEAVRVTGLG